MTVYAIHVNCFGKYHFVCYSHIVEGNYHEVNSAQSHKSETWSIQSSLMQDQATYHTVQKYYCVSTFFLFLGGEGVSKLERITSKNRPTVLDKVFRKECGPSQRMY